MRRNNLYPPLRYIQTFLSHRALAERVLKFKLDVDYCPLLPPTEIAEATGQLWTDSIIPKIMDGHSSEFYLRTQLAGALPFTSPYAGH